MKPQNIAELIQKQNTHNANAIAIMAPDCTPLSYALLYQQLQYVKLTLHRAGIKKNDPIVIVLPNGPEMAVAFLSIAAYTVCAPLNPAYREAEFDFYLDDLKAKAVIVEADSDSPIIRVAQQRNIPIIELKMDPKNGAGKFLLTSPSHKSNPSPEFAKTDDIALILHTSGTTSRPKMVPLTHKNLCVSAKNIQHTLKLTEHDRCLNIMPLFHIHGLMGVLLSSIYAGGSVVCTPGLDGSQFFNWMTTLHPTWYSAVPTMHQMILKEAKSNREVIKQYPLRFIRSSSASLSPIVMSDLEKTFNAPVIESYGMTEAAHQMASNPLPPGERKPGSVGPAAGPDIAIMDQGGTLLPNGQVGEIVIRGANVTRGYGNNIEANRMAFTSGWFRTGDQGHMDNNGYLYITGRIKELINRGGEKISPREIDETLLGHPDVVQAVAFSVPHPTLGEDIAAAVILKENRTISESDLRTYALSRMSEHKIPSRIIIVDEIPKGPTGKLQRVGLADQFTAHLEIHYLPPQGQAEITLAEIWKEVLKIQRVGRNDNFFFLGGDSLRAAQISVRIKNVFQIDLPIITIFLDPTPKGQASLIEEMILKEIEALSEEEASQFDI